MSFFRPLAMSRFAIRIGLFSGARKLWNCLALHLVVDDTLKTLRFTVAIPKLFTVFLEVPQLPYWLGGKTLAGGVGERSEYGFWHDFHETKLQWRRILNLPPPRAGWEKRWVHRMIDNPDVFRSESLVSSLVSDAGEAWANAHGVIGWRFAISTWRALSIKWWIPSLYDHYFILYATTADGGHHEVTLKVQLSPKMDANHIFAQLSSQIVLT
jgi:hypothetical protein